MKSILFVINTMGMGGGAKAILEMFKQMDLKKYEVSLFILTGQGELINEIPERVNLLNKKYFPISVLDKAGSVRLFKTVIKSMFTRGTIFKRSGYIINNLKEMLKKRNVQKDKLLWKVFSDGAQRLEQEFDLAIAYLEGGSAYYVASHVKAKKKVAFLHTNYELAGYNRRLDEACYLKFDRVFTVSENTKSVFLSVYPECKERTVVLYNLIDRENIISKAHEGNGFSDDFDGFRILTVGRLVPEKGYEIAIDAMKILKSTGKSIRWYVLGEGNSRKKLEKKIKALGLEKDFILLGAVDNPFPFYAQCNLYVHATYYEGKSIAIQEAQVLGCAILASDYSGVREQIKNGVDGKICKLDSEELAKNILTFVEYPQKMIEYRLAASKRKQTDNQKELDKLIIDCLGNDK